MTSRTLLIDEAQIIERAQVIYETMPTYARGFVYIIQGRLTKRIKIGFSDRIQGRMTALRAANADDIDLLCLFAETKMLEAHLHERYAKHRLHGEWFDHAPAILRLAQDTRTIGQANTLPGVGWRK